MMPLWTTPVRDRTVSAGGELVVDLPVNALRKVLVTFSGNQDAASASSDESPRLIDLVGMIQEVSVLYRGTTVVGLSGPLAWLMGGVLCGSVPVVSRSGDGLGETVSVTLPIYLGHKWAGEGSAFPASRRGELQLRLRFGALSPKLDGGSLRVTVTALEYLEAEPKSWLKYVELVRTFTATGEQDVDVSMGYPVLGWGIVMESRYPFAGGLPTVVSAKLLVDGVEQVVGEVFSGPLVDLFASGRGLGLAASEHLHRENFDGAYTQGAEGGRVLSVGPVHGRAFWLPVGDDSEVQVLDTRGHGRVNFRFVAGQTDTVRIAQLERVTVSAEGGA
jgi:hypothetical protein